MTHRSVSPLSSCLGTIRPRWRLVNGRWRQRIGFVCSACGLHFAGDGQGGYVAGMNKLPISESSEIQNSGLDKLEV